MQSEDVAQAALDALAGKTSTYRSAVRIAADQLRRMVQESESANGGAAPHAASTLGAFAAGRINVARFADVIAPGGTRDAEWAATARQALTVLEALAARGDDLFRVRVEPGADLVAAVESALAKAGRAFGAARLVASSNGVHRASAANLEAFPFRHWSRAERDLAPPLVIEVAGDDLVVAGLGAYLDGAQSFVLLVDGPATSAPLARLIAPGVLVMQTDDPAALAELRKTGGPAVAAVMPAECARFVHRPNASGGPGIVEATNLPAKEPRRPMGATSVAQQRQELALLAAHTAHPEPQPVAAAATNGHAHQADVAHLNGNQAAPDPVGALAAWLLSRVDLSDLESGQS